MEMSGGETIPHVGYVDPENLDAEAMAERGRHIQFWEGATCPQCGLDTLHAEPAHTTAHGWIWDSVACTACGLEGISPDWLEALYGPREVKVG